MCQHKIWSTINVYAIIRERPPRRELAFRSQDARRRITIDLVQYNRVFCPFFRVTIQNSLRFHDVGSRSFRRAALCRSKRSSACFAKEKGQKGRRTLHDEVHSRARPKGAEIRGDRDEIAINLLSHFPSFSRGSVHNPPRYGNDYFNTSTLHDCVHL